MTSVDQARLVAYLVIRPGKPVGFAKKKKKNYYASKVKLFS